MIFPRVNYCTFADDRILHSKGKGEAAHGDFAIYPLAPLRLRTFRAIRIHLVETP
ncbi:hypothetical protein RUA8715_02103 [Ruegeria arenilitoris]|uniref:Uncharacterized protein n=1 Tax=Ruegeria arenilitoris TaxID=1173585 RepID=A0A238KG48_9RHOB|nr:hypothetical protein RUA8715_02103 [Ruegeria arenilitoris]